MLKKLPRRGTWERLIISFGFMVVSLCFLAWTITHHTDRVQEQVDNCAHVEYSIRPGDTLFSILADRVSERHDVREYVFLTEKNNPGLEPGNLKVGQRIILCLPNE